MTALRRALVLSLLAGSLSGCLGFLDLDYLVPSKRVEKVRETADMYGQYLRFGRIPEAASFVRKEDRKVFLETFLGLDKKIEFTSAEILAVESASPMTVEVWTSYELFTRPSIRIETIRERQLWHFDAVRRVWQVQPDLSAFPGSGIAPAASPPQASAR